MSRAAGPGPGAYMLPTTVGFDQHDVRKHRRPQYSFGVKGTLKDKQLGPGPAAYNPDKFTRYGPSSDPAYSLATRTAINQKQIGPGPAGYDISGQTDYKGKRAPAYSIAARTVIPTKSITPGPNAYAYGVGFVKPGIPAYSMGLRTKVMSAKGQSPGPAAYGAGELDTILKRNPAFSLGQRTNLKSKNISPGPNNYDLQGYKPGDGAPAFSFGVKHGANAPPMIVDCDN